MVALARMSKFVIFTKYFYTASGLFDDGQEYHYSYLAHTSTGVREPQETSSSFGISGEVIIQKKANEAIIKVRLNIFSKIAISIP